MEHHTPSLSAEPISQALFTKIVGELARNLSDADQSTQPYLPSPITDIPLKSWVAMFRHLIDHPWRVYCEPGSEVALYVAESSMVACDRTTWATSRLN